MEVFENEDYQEALADAESRVKNLVWTVAGDYDAQPKIDLELYEQAREIVFYDAIRQGAFAGLYQGDFFSMYLVKKLYCGAVEQDLILVAQTCIDAAVGDRVCEQRPGVVEIRREAMDSILRYSLSSLSGNEAGRLKLLWVRKCLYGRRIETAANEWALDQLESLNQEADEELLVRVTDALYNRIVDRTFEKKHGTLSQVLSVSIEEMQEFGWKDFLKETAEEMTLSEYMDQMQNALSGEALVKAKKEKDKKRVPTRIVLDDAALERMDRFMQLNFGRSLLNKQEQEHYNRLYCQGAHANCSLYVTGGILADPVLENAQYVTAARQEAANRRFLTNNRNMVRSTVDYMTRQLRQALTRRMEPTIISSTYGRIVPNLMWKPGRVDDPLLFQREEKLSSMDLVVDILMDASGSQRKRQSEVALQAYMISETLCNLNIPHRIMGYCTFWDYTVLQRLHDYNDAREENRNIFRYTTTANNRDGLAIRAVGQTLLTRPEEQKILIVLSDGRPNDRTAARKDSRNPAPYTGDAAIKDTAAEIRKLRAEHVSVLGIFTGEEEDLFAEKRIFGRDFVYIHSLDAFSRSVSAYLKKLLEERE